MCNTLMFIIYDQYKLLSMRLNILLFTLNIVFIILPSTLALVEFICLFKVGQMLQYRLPLNIYARCFSSEGEGMHA